MFADLGNIITLTGRLLYVLYHRSVQRYYSNYYSKHYSRNLSLALMSIYLHIKIRYCYKSNFFNG